MKGKFPTIVFAAVALIVAVVASSCGPPQIEQYQEIDSSETAFVVSLEGDKSDQVKFDSADAVEKLRVAARRVQIPTRKKSIGRMLGEYEWIPTVKVIVVDRAPITREWAQDDNDGSKRDADAIYVESKESIGFSLAVTITCSIKESEAHKFLYWYGGKSLSSVMDENIRSVIASEMSKRFGAMSLNECREKKGGVFDEIKSVVSEEFETKGITIMSFGNSGGLQYENQEIQATMTREFVSQNELRIANNEYEANEVKRKNTLADAENERKKAEEFAKAQVAAEAKQRLTIAERAVEKWNGDVPTFLVVGDGAVAPDMLLDISKMQLPPGQ